MYFFDIGKKNIVQELLGTVIEVKGLVSVLIAQPVSILQETKLLQCDFFPVLCSLTVDDLKISYSNWLRANHRNSFFPRSEYKYLSRV